MKTLPDILGLVAYIVVIAPDSFKGTLSAREAGRAIADGWLSVRAEDSVVILPLADGGEGTLDAVEAAIPAARRHAVGLVTGPDGRATPGEWLELPGGTAVVELAQSSGLPLMASLDAMGATTRGLGEVILAVCESGASSLVVALGGSASTDGGAGALRALGLQMIDRFGSPVPDGGRGLAAIAEITGGLPSLAGGVTLLTDVTAPLLGPAGAAAVFGPQKGASPAEIAELDAALQHFADLLGGDPTAPGSGAAGGAGFGFAAAWDARITSGAGYLAELAGLDEAIGTADIVLTGEGRFDEQSRTGKIVGHVLQLAESAGTTAGVIAGQIMAEPGVWASSLADLAGSPDAAMTETARWLRLAGAEAARELA